MTTRRWTRWPWGARTGGGINGSAKRGDRYKNASCAYLMPNPAACCVERRHVRDDDAVADLEAVLHFDGVHRRAAEQHRDAVGLALVRRDLEDAHRALRPVRSPDGPMYITFASRSIGSCRPPPGRSACRAEAGRRSTPRPSPCLAPTTDPFASRDPSRCVLLCRSIVAGRPGTTSFARFSGTRSTALSLPGCTTRASRPPALMYWPSSSGGLPSALQLARLGRRHAHRRDAVLLVGENCA